MILAALVAAAVQAAAAPAPEPAQVSVRRDGDGFIAEFRLPRSEPAWGFFRSSPTADEAKSWRLQSWQLLTPGVRLERRGKLDALVGIDGRDVPQTVRVRVTPFTGHLESDYVPAMKLGGDSIALFDGHFSIFSVDRAERLDTLPGAVDPATVTDGGTVIRFTGPGLVLAGDVEGYRAGMSAGTYGLYDVPGAVARNGVATVIDAELPPWITRDLTEFSPRVFHLLTTKLGPSGVTQPTILAAWEGSDREGASFNGGALKGLILMRFEGETALRQLPALTDLAHWFIAHEMSHFWLGQTVRYESPLDSWILEGGADLIAVRIVQSLNPQFDPTKKINELIGECVTLADEPVDSGHERHEPRAAYACGAVFGLVAERASGGDFFAFTRRLLADNRDDGILEAEEWYSALDRATGSSKQSAMIRALVADGAHDPSAALAALLGEAGIAFNLDAKGVPQLQ